VATPGNFKIVGGYSDRPRHLEAEAGLTTTPPRRHHRYSELRARVQALGHRLLDDGDEEINNRIYYVEEPTKGKIVAVGRHAQIARWLEAEEEGRRDTAEEALKIRSQ
jgi:hypothetical protein